MTQFWQKDTKGRHSHLGTDERMAVTVTKHGWRSHLGVGVMGGLLPFLKNVLLFFKLYAVNRYQLYVLEQN